MHIKIFHNPTCSKSREAFEYLQAQQVELEVVDYLKTPPTEKELRQLIKQLGVAPSSLVRARDFTRLELQPPEQSDGWIDLILEHPILLERPIVVCGNRARIAKPLEQLIDWLEELGSSNSRLSPDR